MKKDMVERILNDDRPPPRTSILHPQELHRYPATFLLGPVARPNRVDTLDSARGYEPRNLGQQQSSMGGKIVRTIGIARARFKIGMMNLGYNIRRLVQLERRRLRPLERAHGWRPCVVQKASYGNFLPRAAW
jgi:hypothetical protein